MVYDWCFTGYWIPLSKTLLTQTVISYQNYSYKHFKIDSEPKLFIWSRALNERSAYSTIRISKRELHKRGICLKYWSLWCKNHRKVNYSLMKSVFYIMVFHEKYAKLKLLMLVTLLKLGCFSTTDNMVSTVKIRVIFSLKEKTIQFPFSLNLYFQQPQSCQFATYQRNVLFEFLTSQTGQMSFPIFKVIIIKNH